MPFDIASAMRMINDHTCDQEQRHGPPGLKEPRNYIMGQKGKKLRSLLCLYGYYLYKDDIKRALEIAYCFELFHNFSLVHDDIMDDADTRRGLPSIPAKYGTNSAILVGDAMLIEVFERLTRLRISNPLELIYQFSETARQVCEGQAMDMDFEKKNDVTIADYLKMIELKTAVLLAQCLRSGAIQADAPYEDRHHLYHFALNAGIAFQLQDDFLDVFGETKLFGKRLGGDIIQGKKTYLYLRTLQLLSEDNRESFKNLYLDNHLGHDEKIRQVQRVFEQVHIVVYCQEAMRSYFNLALSHLKAVTAPDEKKAELVKFAETLFVREV